MQHTDSTVGFNSCYILKIVLTVKNAFIVYLVTLAGVIDTSNQDINLSTDAAARLDEIRHHILGLYDYFANQQTIIIDWNTNLSELYDYMLNILF